MTLPAEATRDPLFLQLQEALAGRYALLAELGRGGMGIVYLAREIRLDRLVALKLLPPALSATPELRARFVRETRIAAKLSQPNIVPIHAADEAGPFAFYAMAYVDGESLAALLARRGALPPDEAVRILREVAWALAHAHGHGIIHRDIKPDNVLIERGSGRALVTDFGIAHVAGGESSGGHPIGTPAYMSPEQMAGGVLDARSDLYSLGVLAFALLAGRLPFEDAAHRKLTAPAPALRALAPGVPAALARTVDRLLATKPDDRPARAEDVIAALDAGTTVARLPAPLERFIVSGEQLRASDAFLTTLGTAPLIWMLDLLFDGFFSQGGFDETAGLVVVVGAPLMLWAADRVVELRRLRRQGYGIRDIVSALEARARAEASEADAEPATGAWHRVLDTARGAAAVGLIAGGAVVFRNLLAEQSFAAILTGLYAVTASLAASWKVLAAGKPTLRARLASWRARFWQGRIGRTVAKLAGGDAPATAAALAFRPTELAVGAVARDLFDALPAAARTQLGDLPSLVRRLEDRAQRAREAGDDAALADALSVLESLRLDLLRASAATREGLTAEFDAAGRVGAEVDALLEGRRAAERLLGGATPA